MLPRYARILVVDDSALICRAVRAMLEKLGLANLDDARNGAQALALIASRRYALVISDWLMEPVSGIELLRTLRGSAQTRHLPFIMMTTQTERKFREIARDGGATHFLAKPFSVELLREKIETLGAGSHADASP